MGIRNGEVEEEVSKAMSRGVKEEDEKRFCKERKREKWVMVVFLERDKER